MRGKDKLGLWPNVTEQRCYVLQNTTAQLQSSAIKSTSYTPNTLYTPTTLFQLGVQDDALGKKIIVP